VARRQFKPLQALSDIQKRRFFAKVRLHQTEDGCDLWIAGRNDDGYGKVTINKYSFTASRVAYFMATGIDPKELKVCHVCDNTRCVRFEHLFLGTNADNSADMVKKGRQCRGDKHYSKTEPEKLLRGEQIGNSKNKPETVLKIRELYFSGAFTQVQLAKMFGISQPQVSCITRGAHWKHVINPPISESDLTDRG
jgi:predicted XRE-type DNA-binding protein